MAPVPTTRLETRDLLDDESLAIDEFVVQALREDSEFKVALSLMPGDVAARATPIAVHALICIDVGYCFHQRRAEISRHGSASDERWMCYFDVQYFALTALIISL